MGDIYRRAAQTVPWLRDQLKGLAPDGLSLRQGLEFSLTENSNRPNGMMHLTSVPSSKIERTTMADKSFDRYKDDQNIVHILKSNWWQRSWTTQKILLATKATVMVGPDHHPAHAWRTQSTTNHPYYSIQYVSTAAARRTHRKPPENLAL
ncbi:putative Heterokaryon incompatibility domain-containing protein [Seiridium cardinale]